MTSSCLRHTIIAAGLLSLTATPGFAQANAQTPQPQAPQPTEPCVGTPWGTKDTITYEDFDFWVGEWHVYDTDSGELRGFDDVQKTLSGCVITQHWRQMDDLYSPWGSNRRLQGKSFTAIGATGEWRQLWTDNGGGNLVFTGRLDEEGKMKITSEWYEVPTPDSKTATIRNVWIWDPISENEIHNWGFVQVGDEDGELRKYFDITYRRSAMGGPTAKAR